MAAWMKRSPSARRFNPRFLIDALRAVDEEEVTMYLVSPKAPCFIRDKQDMYCYLILPVNFITID